MSCLSWSKFSERVWSFLFGTRNLKIKRQNRYTDTNLDPVHFPPRHLQVIFDAALAVFTCAVKEVLRFQQSLSLLWQVQEVHIGNCQLLSLWDLSQRTQLNPEEEQHSLLESWFHFIQWFIHNPRTAAKPFSIVWLSVPSIHLTGWWTAGY